MRRKAWGRQPNSQAVTKGPAHQPVKPNSAKQRTSRYPGAYIQCGLSGKLCNFVWAWCWNIKCAIDCKVVLWLAPQTLGGPPQLASHGVRVWPSLINIIMTSDTPKRHMYYGVSANHKVDCLMGFSWWSHTACLWDGNGISEMQTPISELKRIVSEMNIYL